MKKKFIIATVIEGMYDAKRLMPYTVYMYDTKKMAEMNIEEMLKTSKDDEVKIYCILPCYVKEI